MSPRIKIQKTGSTRLGLENYVYCIVMKLFPFLVWVEHAPVVCRSIFVRPTSCTCLFKYCLVILYRGGMCSVHRQVCYVTVGALQHNMPCKYSEQASPHENGHLCDPQHLQKALMLTKVGASKRNSCEQKNKCDKGRYIL